MNSTLLKFGFIEIKWYSFFILLAFLTASFLIIKEAKTKKINTDFIYDLLFYGIIIGILGARIYYVLFNLDYYLLNPLEIFMIWNGGLAIHGGLLTSLVFLIYYSKNKDINTLLLIDIIVVGLILAQSIGRWGNFFNSEAYGKIVSLNYLKRLYLPNFIIKGMYINGNYHEPTFLYESISSIICFIVLLIIRKYGKIKIGFLSGIYLIWYGITRFIIENMRIDSLMLGPLKMAKIVSIIFIISGIYLIIKSKNNKVY